MIFSIYHPFIFLKNDIIYYYALYDFVISIPFCT